MHYQNRRFEDYPGNGTTALDHESTTSDPWIKRLPSELSPSREWDTSCVTCHRSLPSKQPPNQEYTYNKIHQPKTFWQRAGRSMIRFCETTSLKGVPKIVSTKKKSRRLLWTIFVVGLFVGCITCLVLIIRQYREMDVLLQRKIFLDSDRPFPTISLCNQRPFSSSGIGRIKYEDLGSMHEYMEFVNNKLESLNITQSPPITNYLEDQKALKPVNYQLDTYLLNLPPDISIDHLGHPQDALIMRCNVSFKDNPASKTCFEAGEWRRAYNKELFNCYSFTLRESVISDVQSVDMWLNLDNAEKSECFTCNPNSGVSGTRLYLHAPNTYPQELSDKGYNMMPGTLTEIRYLTMEWQMLQPPYGNCSWDHVSHLDFSNLTYAYTQSACKLFLVQEKKASQCDCVDYGTSVPNHLLHFVKAGKFCEMFKFPVEMMTEEVDIELLRSSFNAYKQSVHCSLNVNEQMETESDVKCPLPCKYSTYETSSISAASWPTKTFQVAFYQSLLLEMEEITNELNSNFKEDMTDYVHSRKQHLEAVSHARTDLLKKMREFRDITDLIARGNKSEATKRLQDTVFMEDNFLAIHITRSDTGTIEIKQKPVISLTSFLSQVGGLLSIWIGLSFIIVVEIIELVMNLFASAPPFE